MTTAAPRTGQHARPELPAAPLGPGSITWQHFGDVRHLLFTGRAGVLQTMHPAISQALLDHSDYFADPIDRIMRSSGPILGVVYDADPEATGRSVRDWHRPIRSSRASGAGPKGYRALDPEVFFWAHATFVEACFTGAKLFGRRFTADEERRFYAESVTWYRRYGMSMKTVPASFDAFWEYWDHMLADVLQATPVAAQAVERSRFPAAPPGVPALAWKPLEPLFARGAQWATTGVLPPRAREILGARWRPADEVVLRTLIGSMRASWPLVPERFRYLPAARGGIDRAARANREPRAAT